MKRIIISFSILFFTILLISSCDNNKISAPTSSGKTAEIIVVTNNQVQWNGVVGDSVRAFFGREFEILPQPEPFFQLGYVPAAGFNKTKMFKSHHNVLFIDIDKKHINPGLEAKKNLWSNPQRVVNISAQNDLAFLKLFSENKEGILKIFMQSERERIFNLFKAFRDVEIQNKILKNLNLSLEVPGGFLVAKKAPGFIWLRKETDHHSQGILIYTYDYNDTASFSKKRIVSYRDSITKEYIPGPSEGSYMDISEKYIPPVSKRIDFNGMFAVETRGLWEVNGNFMGGPFINYTLVNEKTNKVVTLDGYVYAPNAPKRDLLLQLETIIYSLKFVN